MERAPDLTLQSLTDQVRQANESETASTSSIDAPPANLVAAATAAELDAPIVAKPAAEPFVPMPRPDWCDLWLKCHDIGGHAIGSRVLAGTSRRSGGMDAAGAIYDTCLDTPALHWVIAPGGKWFQRIAVAGAFYAPLVGELRDERRRQAAPPRAAAPAAPRDVPGVPLEGSGLVLPPDGAQ